MLYPIHTLTLLLLFLMTLPVVATSATLSDGSQITLDPTTGKMFRQGSNGSSVLWDGTHRLNDGSVVIIRDGIAITGQTTSPAPIDSEATQKQGNQQPPTSPQKVSPCLDLMIKVCGFNGACNSNPACSPARQLVELEKEETWKNIANKSGGSGDQCRKALSDESFFSPCSKTIATKEPTPCQNLVSRVCGEEYGCIDTEGCTLAEQLLKMENDELRTIQDPNRLAGTSKQCKEVSRRRNTFPTCRVDMEEEEEDCE